MPERRNVTCSTDQATGSTSLEHTFVQHWSRVFNMPYKKHTQRHTEQKRTIRWAILCGRKKKTAQDEQTETTKST